MVTTSLDATMVLISIKPGTKPQCGSSGDTEVLTEETPETILLHDADNHNSNSHNPNGKWHHPSENQRVVLETIHQKVSHDPEGILSESSSYLRQRPERSPDHLRVTVGAGIIIASKARRGESHGALPRQQRSRVCKLSGLFSPSPDRRRAPPTHTHVTGSAFSREGARDAAKKLTASPGETPSAGSTDTFFTEAPSQDEHVARTANYGSATHGEGDFIVVGLVQYPRRAPGTWKEQTHISVTSDTPVLRWHLCELTCGEPLKSTSLRH